MDWSPLASFTGLLRASQWSRVRTGRGPSLVIHRDTMPRRQTFDSTVGLNSPGRERSIEVWKAGWLSVVEGSAARGS